MIAELVTIRALLQCFQGKTVVAKTPAVTIMGKLHYVPKSAAEESNGIAVSSVEFVDGSQEAMAIIQFTEEDVINIEITRQHEGSDHPVIWIGEKTL